MFTLSNFYNSKQWRNFVIVLRLERMNEDGEVVCERCGEPITKEYDCIGHHVVELTEENVNDYTISLNPDNVQLVHHRCHNKIHDKFGYSRRRIYLVYGSPLAGKTTYVDNVKREGDLIVDIDNIWECVSGCKRYVKPDRLKVNVFGIRDRLIEDVRLRRGKWLNAYIIGGYPLIGERERLCKELGAEEIYIESTIEECMSRLDDERKDWIQFINEWWRLYTPTY